jgi:ATP-binding protein involved in chromosome partitioning
MLDTSLMAVPNELARQAETALAEWIDPLLGRDLLSIGAITKLEAFTFRLFVDVELGFPAASHAPLLTRELERHLLTRTQAKAVKVSVSWTVNAVNAGDWLANCGNDSQG